MKERVYMGIFKFYFQAMLKRSFAWFRPLHLFMASEHAERPRFCDVFKALLTRFGQIMISASHTRAECGP